MTMSTQQKISSDNFFEDNFDLKAILDEEGIDYTENHKHIFLSECPECGKKDKLNIDQKSKLWICWYCSKDGEDGYGRGNLWTLLLSLGFDEFQVKQMFKGKKYHRYTDVFAFETMNWQAHDDGEEDHAKEINPVVIPEYLIYLDRTEEQIRRLPEVYTYLWNRFVRTKEQYQRFLLYYHPYQKRVVFPAITRNGVCIGLQSRDITDRHRQDHPKCTNRECDLRFHYYFKGEEEAPENCPNCGEPLSEEMYPKSLNTRDFAKTEFFYNEQNIDWSKPVVLVEGPFDSINVNNSMAFLGKFLSDTQFKILMEKNPPKIILYMDGDAAGNLSSVDIYNQIRAFIDVEIVCTPEGDDPGSHDLEYNQKMVDTACQPQEWFARKGLMYM